MTGSSWLLGGGYTWHSADPAAAEPGWDTSAVVANPIRGLSLPPLPDGPRGLLSADDSLGALTLPRGIAVDGEVVLVLSTAGDRVFRYDAVRATLAPLPEIGVEGLGCDPPAASLAEPRRFRGAPNIAAAAGLLYVVDPQARRVQVFDLATLALVRIHAGLREPIDAAARDNAVYILDGAAGRVYRADPSRDALMLVVDAPWMRGRWDRMAADRDGRIYLRDRSGGRATLHVFVPSNGAPVRRPAEQFGNSDEVRDRFDLLGVSIDEHGVIHLPARLLDPCGLRAPRDAATRTWQVADRIFAIDTRLRVLRVHLRDGRARHTFGPYDGAGRAVAHDDRDAWTPVDVLALDGCVLVLDERHRTVYALQPGAETLRRRFAASADALRAWRRLADDGRGCLLLWDGVGEVVDRVDARGRLLEQVPRREVRQRFERAAAPAASPQVPRLTRDGATPAPSDERTSYPKPAYATHGVWTSTWLDSDLYNCQWHVMELSVAALPPGSRVVVRTRTSNEAQTDDEVLASLGTVGALGSWRETPPLSGVPQPSEEESKPREIDLLVPSGPGQYIQLQIELTGSGLTTPVIERLRIEFPRESLLQYLPAIYSKPEEQRDFLDRFLSIAQRTWTAIERDVENFPRFLDADSVPASALGWLAGWLGLTLEGEWTADQNRRLLRALPALRTTWGTAAGLRAWLRVYLANIAGVEPEQLEEAGIPGIVESFVDRRRLLLGHSDGAALCAGAALWSPAVQRRFQVGVFDRVGEIELVSTGHPDGDLFRHYAHAFRVFVPAAFIRTPAHEALLRRAIEIQKPAHTTYELVLVEPRFRIGEQSTIELDTVIGAAAPGPLLCATVVDPPARPAYQRLSFDVALGCGCGDRPGSGLDGRLG